MLLSINEAKVAELLSSSDKGYAVFISDVPVSSQNYAPQNCVPAYPVTSETFGVVYSPPLLVTPETREHLMDARRKIEESGIPLKSTNELDKEIDEMRGRSR